MSATTTRLPLRTCLQETPVVPGRDRDIRRAPLRPEWKLVWIHILQLPSNQLVTNLLPKRYRLNQNHVRDGSSHWALPETVRCLHPPPCPGHKLWRSTGLIFTRICQHGRYPRFTCQRGRDSHPSKMNWCVKPGALISHQQLPFRRGDPNFGV